MKGVTEAVAGHDWGYGIYFIQLKITVMEEKERKQKFLQLQFCMLLLACTLLPDFNSLVSSFLGVPDFDIPVFCCQVIGIAGGGLALYAFYQDMGKNLPVPFLSLSGGGLAIGLLSLFPGVPIWISYVGLIALLVALLICRSSVGVQWGNRGSQGAYLILMAILLHVYDGIGDSMATHVVALIGLVLYWVGLGTLKAGLDAKGLQGVSRLRIAVVLSMIAVLFGWIPLLGGIIAGILLLIAFFVEFMGYGALKQSASLGSEGQSGAGKLRLSMIVLLAGAFIGLFPLTGMVVGLISLVALWLVFQGWKMILAGMEDRCRPSATEEDGF